MRQVSTIVAALVLLCVMRAAAAEPGSADESAVWQDPAFRKHFLGTYGMRSDIEPRVTTIEKALMEKVVPMMATESGQKQAKTMLEKSTRESSSAVLDFTIGNIYFQQGDLEPAAQWYEKAIEKFPAFQRAQKNLGLVYVRLGRYDKAAPPLTRAIELGAVDGFTFGLLGLTHLMAERHASAEGAYRRAIMLQPKAVDWKLGLARCLFKQQKCGEAAAICGELIRDNPAKPEYWLLQANAFLGMKRSMKAAENYEYLDAAGHSTVQSLNTLGDIYVNSGLIDLAADTYMRAAEKGRDGKPDVFLRDAEVLASRGAYGEATRVVVRIKKLFGDSLGTEDKKRLLKLEARFAAATGKAGERHAALLEQIIALDPLDGEALILLAQHYASAGNLEKAEFLFERAEGVARYEAKACLRHAQCLVKNAKYAKALPLLKRANELRPREDVAEYIKQVERVVRIQ